MLRQEGQVHGLMHPLSRKRSRCARRMPTMACGSLGSSQLQRWQPLPSLHLRSSLCPSPAMLGATPLGWPSPWGTALHLSLRCVHGKCSSDIVKDFWRGTNSVCSAPIFRIPISVPPWAYVVSAKDQTHNAPSTDMTT